MLRIELLPGRGRAVVPWGQLPMSGQQQALQQLWRCDTVGML